MKCEIIEHLTREEIQTLSLQGVNLDDWNIMLVFEDGEVALERHIDVIDGDYYLPEDYWIQCLLNAHSDHDWYSGIMFKGEKKTIGVGYH